MRAVVLTDPGVIELNWQWMPAWVGMNSPLLQEMQEALAKQLKGRPIDDRLLDEAHVRVVEFLEKKHPGMAGLGDYLDGLKFVQIG